MDYSEWIWNRHSRKGMVDSSAKHVHRQNSRRGALQIRCARQGVLANITVAPGKYYVLLKFAETPQHTFLERDKNGGRVTHTLDVSINDKKVMSKVNITQAAGGIFKAYDRVFTDIEPETGLSKCGLLDVTTRKP